MQVMIPAYTVLALTTISRIEMMGSDRADHCNLKPAIGGLIFVFDIRHNWHLFGCG